MPALYVEGLAFWAPFLPGWELARAAFRGEIVRGDAPAPRPSPRILAPAERRRAPDCVALALEVACAAVAASGRDAADLPCVFASAQGDLAITDYMGRALCAASPQLSPTRFHNSVHNAAAGYWTIGAGCMQASTSISSGDHTFAAALLETCAQCAADGAPVLLVGFDAQAPGPPLSELHPSRALLAGGMVIAPARTERTVAAMAWSLATTGAAGATPPSSDVACAMPENPMRELLPLFEALAHFPDRQTAAEVRLPLGKQLSLSLRLTE